MALLQHINDRGHHPCRCGGLHHPHRLGTRFCDAHPFAGLHRALRDGLEGSDAILDIWLDIVWDLPGKKGPCPF